MTVVLDWVELHEEPIDVGKVVDFVTSPRVGGIDIFLGTTRAETNAEGKQLVALDYESYPEMALKQMRDLAARARQQWPDIVRLAILHRTGAVEVGRASVIIAVATPHRADAFTACKWIIDMLKVDVAVWKREVWEDGSGSWVHPV